jgi:hypothetical protein
VSIARTVCAAGDLVHPGNLSAGHAVAALAHTIGCDSVLLLGDFVYDMSGMRGFTDLFGSLWGDLLSRSHPALGNHEEVDAYYQYFGAAAGSAGQGYYSFSVGDWLFLGLNTEDARNRAQLAWLRNTLAAKTSRCEVIFGHIPLFSAGPHSSDEKLSGLFSVAQEFGVELALVAHNHNYQRFAPQTPDARPSPTGIRQITIGTGGAPLRRIYDRGFPNLERSDDMTYGLLKLTLQEDGYSGDFVPIPGQAFSDQFSGTCR